MKQYEYLLIDAAMENVPNLRVSDQSPVILRIFLKSVCQVHVLGSSILVQWNLVIKRSDITNPLTNKVILGYLSQLYYISPNMVFLPWYNAELPDITR